jgi:Protein of unknown function (DUF2905)
MLRWLIIITLGLLLIQWLRPWLAKLGFGRLPGDFRFVLLGREWHLPIASTLLLSFVFSLIGVLV